MYCWVRVPFLPGACPEMGPGGAPAPDKTKLVHTQSLLRMYTAEHEF
jgi:hypothetical protein